MIRKNRETGRRRRKKKKKITSQGIEKAPFLIDAMQSFIIEWRVLLNFKTSS